MKKLLVIVCIATIYASCKSLTMQVAVPDQFAANATQMKVSGMNGWKKKPRLSFGNYQTSKLKKGWFFSTRNHERKPAITSEERLLKFFNMSSTKNTRNKYKYTIQDGSLMAEVYCLEKITKEEATMYTSLGDLGRTKNFQYSFSAVILPQTIKNEQWQLVFYNSYDISNDTVSKLWDRPNVEREGYVTNGKIRIDIRPIITDRVVGKDGAALKTPIRLLMAYELKIDGGLIGVIDTFNKNIWIYNDLDKDMKLIIASVSSAILMRKLDESSI